MSDKAQDAAQRETFVKASLARLKIELGADDLREVLKNVEVLQTHADRLASLPLSDDIEVAPVFTA